jgi:hypothetical protein
VHEVRIRGKVLRYALEFHRALYGEDTERLVKPLVELQDRLGAHQDLVATEERLRGEIESREGACSPAFAFLVGRLAERCREEARRLRMEIARESDPLPNPSWRRLERRMRADARTALRSAETPSRVGGSKEVGRTDESASAKQS